MNDWASGYVSEIGYTYGYYSELNPQRIKLAFLRTGLVAPEFGTACELGFGQGMSVNIHAAASVCSWHGTDFNPTQAGFAQELANASGASAHLFDEAFDEFAKRDLPEFDYIGLHGIWSWISDENRRVIVDFISKKLKVGGVLYISYNTLPGWSKFAPLRHLMNEQVEKFGSKGEGIISQIDSALLFTEKLLAVNPMYVTHNLSVNERFNIIKGQNRNYLAHEFFNRDWVPMHFGTVAKWMEPAKMSYACSANYFDYIDLINLTLEQQTFLNQITDPMFRQSARDFMVNQQFRKDYWVKGARKLTSAEQAQGLRQQRLVTKMHRSNVSLKIQGSLGEAALSESIYYPILDLMDDHKVRSIGEIEQSVKDKGVTFGHLIEAVLLLCGNGTLGTVQDDSDIKSCKKYTDALNTHLMLKSRSSDDFGYLSTPVTGGAIEISRFDQLFLLALQQGKKRPEEWAASVAQILAAQGQKIIKDGKPFETPQENLDELLKQAHDFSIKKLPILKALQVA